ncbi:MAG: DUF1553 domain-containing protein [Rhodopirellula sp.]|nr:DUF1553 domain-containing protein [Rhodopirellula sp.]
MNFSVADRRVWKIAGRLDVVVAILFGFFVTSSQAAEPAAVDFNRDIRPILSDNCFECHGPDAEQRQAELRLDTKEGLFRKTDEHSSVVPGDLAKSELFRRMTSTDPDERMPPADSGRKLSQEQIGIVKKWIESGAEWQQHWSFIAPTRPTSPAVSSPEWVKNPIDSFVLARLDREGLQPSDAADRRTLLRRVSFDLAGLPPTPAEVQAFLEDDSPQAYEKVVDRLLKSPRYAERMAVRWLDAARYADTSGYQSDGPRDMWRWRDWVLEAFDRNMPFDNFTIEQLAGDLLPHATLDQKIATGFNRNHRGNAEGGVVPEEFQVEYVVDRVDTTFTVWQGLTMGCGRCHSHKFDPISQKEYYQVFAYFNNIPEYGRAIKEGNSKPFIEAPSPAQQKQLAKRKAHLAAAREKVKAIDRRMPELVAAWQKSVSSPPADWSDTDSLIVRLKLDGSLVNSATEKQGETQRSATTVPEPNEKDAKLQNYEPRFAKAVGVSTSDSASDEPGRFVSGQLDEAIELDGSQTIDAGYLASFGYFEQFTLAAWVRQDEHAGGTILSKMEDGPRAPGYSFDVTGSGTVQLNLVKRWLDDSIRVETTEPLPTGRWIHVCVTYDGSRSSDGIQFYFDGQPVGLKAHHDFLNQTITVNQPLRVGRGQADFHGLIDDVRIYQRPLTAFDVRVIADATPISEFATAPLPGGSGGDVQIPEKLRRYILEVAGPEDVRSAWRDLVQQERELIEFRRSLPTVMVMQETLPRESHILSRGQYDKPGEQVVPGVPAALPPLPEDAPANRLGLARWLVSRDNPLTARVTVNRFWRDIFGTGIVKTTEDFGVQGERPSHPQLLDWLAVEFLDSGWDMRHILKTIVMSATYQQSSRLTPELLARDPTNRLLARGPRFRLTAEMIRDQALFASGLLTEKFGGPSVKPYQPEGLWKEIATDTVYDRSTGPDLYRRSLYTYWKRTVAPPMMASFDASGREMCEVRQSRTNTPLQALNLLNDVTFVEAARVLAQNVLATPGDDQQRLDRIFERLLSRLPSDLEQAILLKSLQRYRQQFKSDHSAAKKLIATGESPPPANVAPVELAAWTNVCSTILNLDECVTKE